MTPLSSLMPPVDWMWSQTQTLSFTLLIRTWRSILLLRGSMKLRSLTRLISSTCGTTVINARLWCSERLESCSRMRGTFVSGGRIYERIVRGLSRLMHTSTKAERSSNEDSVSQWGHSAAHWVEHDSYILRWSSRLNTMTLFCLITTKPTAPQTDINIDIWA